MKIYIVIGYNEDYYTFESYLGAFRTKKEAKDFIEEDYWIDRDGEILPKHDEYKIIEEEV